jgi:hypothetical protein
MTPQLNLRPNSVFTIGEVPMIFAAPNDNIKEVNEAKTFPRLQPMARLATALFEGLAGVLAVLYLSAAIALSGALLYYTFSR